MTAGSMLGLASKSFRTCPVRPAKPSAGGSPGPGRDGRAAEILGCHVPHGLSELPAMARQVLHGAVPLAVLPVHGRLEHARPVRTGTHKLSTDILDPDTDDVRYRVVSRPFSRREP